MAAGGFRNTQAGFAPVLVMFVKRIGRTCMGREYASHENTLVILGVAHHRQQDVSVALANALRLLELEDAEVFGTLPQLRSSLRQLHHVI